MRKLFAAAALAALALAGDAQALVFSPPPIVATVRVVTAAGSITMTVADQVLVVNKTSGAATAVTLPANPVVGEQEVVKDGKGDASTNNITISPASGTIDGASTSVINQAYGSATFIYNGAQWNAF